MAVGSGILPVDVTWFNIGCFDFTVFRVILSVGPIAIVVRCAYANGFPVVRDGLVAIILRTEAVNENVALPLRKITQTLSHCGQMLGVDCAVVLAAI